MEYLNSYSFFILNDALEFLNENIDYEWNLETGEEIDYKTGRIFKNKLEKSFLHSDDKLELFQTILKKVENWNPKVKRFVLIISAILALRYFPDHKIVNASNKTEDPVTVEIIKDVIDKEKSKKDTVFNEIPEDEPQADTTQYVMKSKDKFLDNRKDVNKLKISSKGINFIKEEEKLKLKAYALGDGHITIGYGHAEPKSKSKYKVGDKISEKQANRLLKKDLKTAENGVKSIFKKWKKDEDLDINLNQDQFDALVSLAYNMGVGGLMESDVMKLIKINQLEKAGEQIKDELTDRQKEKFPGLIERRKGESNLFFGKELKKEDKKSV